MFKINNLLSCIIFYNVYIRTISSLVKQMTDNLRTGTYYGKERKKVYQLISNPTDRSYP